MFTAEVEGKLSGKQEQRLDTIGKIVNVLHNEQDDPIWKTASEISHDTGLSKAVLSKHLTELVKQGVVRPEARLVNDKLQAKVFFTAVNKPYLIKGKFPDGRTDKVYYDRKTRTAIWEIATMKKVKGGKRKREVRKPRYEIALEDC